MRLFRPSLYEPILPMKLSKSESSRCKRDTKGGRRESAERLQRQPDLPGGRLRGRPDGQENDRGLRKRYAVTEKRTAHRLPAFYMSNMSENHQKTSSDLIRLFEPASPSQGKAGEWITTPCEHLTNISPMCLSTRQPKRPAPQIPYSRSIRRCGWELAQGIQC